MKSVIRIILLLFTFVLPLCAGGQKDTGSVIPSGAEGKIVYLEGEVTVNNASVEIGDPVLDSDIVATGPDSYCEIVFGGKNVFRLEENTVADIDWSGSSVNINKGAIGAVFTKLEAVVASEDVFSVKTPTAVAGVRGTVFYIKVEDPENTYICICNGELDLGETYKDLNVAADHHKAYRFTGTGDSVSYTSAGMLYHDDPKMESIAQNIDYSIPWGISTEY